MVILKKESIEYFLPDNYCAKARPEEQSCEHPDSYEVDLSPEYNSSGTSLMCCGSCKIIYFDIRRN